MKPTSSLVADNDIVKIGVVRKKNRKSWIALKLFSNSTFTFNDVKKINSRASSDTGPRNLRRATGEQKRKAASFFGSPLLVSEKANEILGPNNDRQSPRWRSDKSLIQQWKEARERKINNILDERLTVEQFKIPPNHTKISDKFVTLCGDDTMKMMAARHVEHKPDTSGKAFKLLGATEFLPGQIKRKFGEDFEERVVAKAIQASVDNINKRSTK